MCPLVNLWEVALKMRTRLLAEIDRQIIDQYCLHPTNLYAYDHALWRARAEAGELCTWSKVSAIREAFEQRINALA